MKSSGSHPQLAGLALTGRPHTYDFLVLSPSGVARNSGGIVIAQVKRIAARGSLHPQRVVVPSTLVDFVVVDPHQKQATEIEYDPALSGEVRLPASAFEPVPFGPDKVIARRAAMEMRRGDAVNLGFGISPLVPYVLIDEGQGDAVTWAIEQGPVGGVPAPGFPFGCAYNAEATFPSPHQFTYFQGGGADWGCSRSSRSAQTEASTCRSWARTRK